MKPDQRRTRRPAMPHPQDPTSDNALELSIARLRAIAEDMVGSRRMLLDDEIRYLSVLARRGQ